VQNPSIKPVIEIIVHINVAHESRGT